MTNEPPKARHQLDIAEGDFIEEFGSDYQAQRALDGDRHASIRMWARIANSEKRLDLSTLAWIQKVAEKILEANRQSAERGRDAEIVKALGLTGREDLHDELRNFAQCLFDFGIDRKSVIESAMRGKAPPQITVFEDYDPSKYSHLDAFEIGKLIDRLVVKPKPGEVSET
ncbi:hypothetical protein AEP_00085 [Curvibacter sp. AEP1-3]|uniref:hypothetical protein n=1 Tax=Curvibacter sp. AEP1-3 TaxID=1844971 RepID=UPI000B3BEEA6|nr:hypothetical protein [Curvibacter sp. AEP1-3]ARV17051.1 hypothetical protein AEP_00085 [Curvibacter sp. AEP1-3]